MLVRFSPLFSADGPPAVPLESPTITATAVRTGRVLTITVTSLTGNPVPAVTAEFALDGTPTELPLVGPGLYEIEVPGTEEVDYAGQLTAANGRPPNAVFSFSGTVPGNLREAVFAEPLVYTLTLPPFIASRLGIAPTGDGNLIATGVGAVTISITSPTEFVGGPFSVDQSEEGAAGTITFEAPLTAPQALLDPVITRTAIAPGGTGFKVGDTFTARRAIWVEDADDTATAQQTGQWRYGTTPIAGATGTTIVAPAPGGNLNYVDTLTGAGATRTAQSNSIAVAAVSRGADFPALTYTLTLPAFTASRNQIVGGDQSIVINALADLNPNLAVGPGDQSIIITGA